MTLPEQQKCKKVIACSGDFDMDQYVSWGLSSEDLNLDIITGKYEQFCKLQANEEHTHFDLLTSFRQGSRSMDEWYNAVQAQVNLANSLLKQPRSCIMTSFGFSCMMKNLYPRP